MDTGKRPPPPPYSDHPEQPGVPVVFLSPTLQQAKCLAPPTTTTAAASYPRWWRRSSPWAAQASSSLDGPVLGSLSGSPRRHRRRPLFDWGIRERLLLALLALSTCWFWLAPWAQARFEDPVDAVLRTTPLIDTHIDFPIFLRAFRGNHINNVTVDEELPGQVDFPRLRRGKLGGVFWSVYVPCPAEPDDDSDLDFALNSDSGSNKGKGKDGDKRFPDSLYTEAVAMSYEQLDLVHRLIARFPTELSYTPTSSAIFHNHQYPPEFLTIGSVAGGEGLHAIGNRAANLRAFYGLGMRYMTLAHNCHNAYADAAVAPDPPVHGGLSARGREMVAEMNRIGMMVDVSHVTPAVMRDAVAHSRAPVIFSHSGAFAKCAHPRNVPDDVLDLLPQTDGVVQVPFLPKFVSENPDDADLAAVADHIEYIGRRIGFAHVGIGSDYDGMPQPAAGLEDVSTYPALLRELWRRGLTQRQLAGVAGANVLRVMARAEAVAAASIGQLPLEDEVDFNPGPPAAAGRE